MTKSTCYLINAEDQLANMKLSDNDDPKVHLVELKQHFQLLMQWHDSLIQMGLTLSTKHLGTIIMLSLLLSYRPALQTITATEKASATVGSAAAKMKPTELINFFIEEAQHYVINDNKSAESTLVAQGKRNKRDPMKKKDKNKSNKKYANSNCGRNGHTIEEC